MSDSPCIHNTRQFCSTVFLFWYISHNIPQRLYWLSKTRNKGLKWFGCKRQCTAIEQESFPPVCDLSSRFYVRGEQPFKLMQWVLMFGFLVHFSLMHKHISLWYKLDLNVRRWCRPGTMRVLSWLGLMGDKEQQEALVIARTHLQQRDMLQEGPSSLSLHFIWEKCTSSQLMQIRVQGSAP